LKQKQSSQNKGHAVKYRLLFCAVATLFTLTHTPLIARVLPAKAVCIVSVANAFNEYLNVKFPQATLQQIKDLSHQVLASNVKNGEFTRIHQFLLHEIVTVLEERNGELLVQASDHFCQNKPEEKVFNTYAVLAEEFVFFDEIRPFLEGLSIEKCLPTPYNWQDSKSFKKTRLILTLTTPYDGFSLGTQFRIIPFTSLEGDFINAHLLTPLPKSDTVYRAWFQIIQIPSKYLLLTTPGTPAEKENCIVEQFMKACTGEKRVPTAWGGNSATALFKKEDYEKTTLGLPDGTNIEGYKRHQVSDIQSGFTMPELTMTFDRMCGVASFMKNSTTWINLGNELKPDQDIKRLDYIAGPGYLGRVISVEENLVADIRSYSQHHGIARLVKLSENFKGIETYTDLVQAYRTNQPLELLNEEHKVIGTFKPGSWKILSFTTEYDAKKWEKFAQQYA
jgi:hypothetical protein